MPYKDAASKRAWWKLHQGYQKQWHLTHPGKQADYDAGRDQEKVKARRKLHNAVSNGDIIKPTYCDNCEQPGEVVAHHPDYTKPLAVEWVCVDCHRNIKH